MQALYQKGKLNKSQSQAIASSITRTFSIWQGPPGTGKTNTLVGLMQVRRRSCRRAQVPPLHNMHAALRPTPSAASAASDAMPFRAHRHGLEAFSRPCVKASCLARSIVGVNFSSQLSALTHGKCCHQLASCGRLRIRTIVQVLVAASESSSHAKELLGRLLVSGGTNACADNLAAAAAAAGLSVARVGNPARVRSLHPPPPPPAARTVAPLPCLQHTA